MYQLNRDNYPLNYWYRLQQSLELYSTHPVFMHINSNHYRICKLKSKSIHYNDWVSNDLIIKMVIKMMDGLDGIQTSGNRYGKQNVGIKLSCLICKIDIHKNYKGIMHWWLILQCYFLFTASYHQYHENINEEHSHHLRHTEASAKWFLHWICQILDWNFELNLSLRTN